MSKSVIKSSIPSKNKPTSKAKVTFEKLLSDIEKQRNQKDLLEKNLKIAREKIAKELHPLEQKDIDLMKNYLLRLDQLAVEIGVGKVNAEWFESYMADTVRAILEAIGFDNEEVYALLTKYTGTTLDDIVQEEEYQDLADKLSDLVGFDVDLKELLSKGEKQFFDDNKERIVESLNNKASLGEQEEPAVTTKASDKTDSLLKKDARAVYMQLVKKLHPDLETDEAEKTKKTEIVKEVTDAYQNNDFFTLLKLHIEHLGEGEHESEKLAEEMLKGYTKLLKKQLAGINEWINDIKHFEGNLIEDFLDKNLKFSPQKFAARRKRLESNIKFKETDLLRSTKSPKTWFKEQIKQIKQEMQQNMMEDMLFNMFNGPNPF